MAYSGQAFGLPGTAITQTLGYNGRNELTESTWDVGYTDRDRSYEYDPIGNRTDTTEGGSAVSTDYSANELNQYSFVGATITGGEPAVQRPTYDADGNLTETYVAADMNLDGVCNNFDITPFSYALTHTEAEFQAAYPDGCYWCADVNGDSALNNFDISPFMALASNGNAAVWVRYTWDAENRLIAVEPGGPPAEGDEKVEFAYDYLGRRIEKKVSTYDGDDWVLTTDRRFVWAGGGTGGWLMLMELEDGGTGFQPVRSYTWGLDLAGQAGACGTGFQPVSGAPCLESAGTIGGLLAVHDAAIGENGADYVYTYDANGNVGQVIDLSAASASASIVAHYEYDPYGNVTAQSGAYAEINPFRFSTKYWDDETGLGYWGYRYYSPKLGRWMSRDPIEERGGRNLYAYASNDAIDLVDYVGAQASPPSAPSCDPSACFDIKPKKVKCKATYVTSSGSCPNVDTGNYESAACDTIAEMAKKAKKDGKSMTQSCGGPCGCSSPTQLNGSATITSTQTATFCWTPGFLGPNKVDCATAPPTASKCVVTLTITVTVEGTGWYGSCVPPASQPTTQPTQPTSGGCSQPSGGDGPR